MRVLGIDPGLSVTGYACLGLDGDSTGPKLVEAGVLRLTRATPIAFRLAQLHDDLSQLLDSLGPDMMVVEKLFASYHHPRTSILMGHARGVVLLAAQVRGIEIEEVSATLVKKALTGHGHASKQQMQRAVASQLRLEVLPTPPDVADAIAIAWTAARRRLVAGRIPG